MSMLDSNYVYLRSYNVSMSLKGESSQKIDPSGGKTPLCRTHNSLCSKWYKLGNLVNNFLAYFKQYWDEHIHITIILYGMDE